MNVFAFNFSFILFISILFVVFSIQVLHLFIRAVSKYFTLLSDYRWYYNLNFDFSWWLLVYRGTFDFLFLIFYLVTLLSSLVLRRIFFLIFEIFYIQLQCHLVIETVLFLLLVPYMLLSYCTFWDCNTLLNNGGENDHPLFFNLRGKVSN